MSEVDSFLQNKIHAIDTERERSGGGTRGEKKQAQSIRPEETVLVRKVQQILEQMQMSHGSAEIGTSVPDCPFGHWPGLGKVDGYKTTCRDGERCVKRGCQLFHRGIDRGVRLCGKPGPGNPLPWG